jgi:hypothetical protein
MRRPASICLSVIFFTAPCSKSCDLCGCYTPQFEASSQSNTTTAYVSENAITSSGRFWANGLYGAVGEQFTHFGTLQFEGNEVANPTDQYLNSWVTQLVVGYACNDRFALQLNMPFIYRSFRRPEGFEIDQGTESGLGDISLLGKFVVFHIESQEPKSTDNKDAKSPKVELREPDFGCSVVLLAGIKFPTGDTSRIKEEFNEVEVPGAPESGIHGHDLTLGTGSYDGIFGAQASARYRDWFFQCDLQFALRGDGLHQYDFANDLSWAGGPGYYLSRRGNATVGAQFVVSGEHKGLDSFRGQPAEDTGITSVFVGPRLTAAFGRVSAEIAIDLPVSIDNTALQAVPDYRIRGGIAFQF